MAKILLCDDAEFMRRMLKDILTKQGHEIVGEAKNGREAIEKFKETSPDLVMLDVTMPEMDGIQGLKGIMKVNPKAKCVMCSAMGQQSIVIDALQSGALDFLVKPFAIDRVTEMVAKYAG